MKAKQEKMRKGEGNEQTVKNIFIKKKEK